MNGAARMVKAFKPEATTGQRSEIYRHLCTVECAGRADEMWEALRYQYSMLISDSKTVKELHIKMTTATVTSLGSLIKTHPPVGSIIDPLRKKGKFLEVNQIRWSKKPLEGQEIKRENMAEIPVMIVDLRSEVADLGYAMRKHNWRHQDSPENQLILQDLFSDWVNLKYNLPLERAAAVTHLQAVVMLSSLLHAWLRNFRLLGVVNPFVWDIERVMEMLTDALDAPEDTLGTGWIPHIMMADNGTLFNVQ